MFEGAPSGHVRESAPRKAGWAGVSGPPAVPCYFHSSWAWTPTQGFSRALPGGLSTASLLIKGLLPHSPSTWPGGGGLRAFCKHLSYRSSDRRGVPSLSVPRGVGRGRSREMCQAGLWGSGRTCKVSAWPPGSTHTWGHGGVRRGQRAGLLPWCPQGSITAWRLQQGAQDAGRASPEGGACSP